MSYHRHRSRTNKRKNRSNDYLRRSDSYHPHPIQSNRQYDYHYSPVSINEIISHIEEYSPIIQSLIRELLLEQGKHKLTEERLNRCERDYASLYVFNMNR